MKIKTFTLIILCGILMPYSLLAQSTYQNKSEKGVTFGGDYNISSGIGASYIPGNIFSTGTSNLMVQLGVLKWNNLTIGLCGSMIGMQLGNYDFNLSPRQHEMMQIFVGPQVTYEHFFQSAKDLSTSFYGALGYTRSLTNTKGAKFTGNLENLNNGQNGLGFLMGLQLKKYIGKNYYLCASYDMQLGSIKIGTAENPHKLIWGNGSPHIGFGFKF